MYRIDDTDYAILKCIDDGGKPLWKNKIHECIKERTDELPIMSTVSVQTVGRRVDNLTDEEFLESCIVSPEEIKRDLIIAFKITEKGVETLEEKTEDYLQQAVQTGIFAHQEETPIGKNALIELIHDRFELGKDTKEMMQREYSRDELIMLMTLYYVRREVAESFTQENVKKFASLADKNMELSEVLSRYMKNEKE